MPRPPICGGSTRVPGSSAGSANKDPRADYAIARVSRQRGGSVEAQAGSALTLGVAPAPGTRVTVMGYPAGVGGPPIGCQASTGITDSGFPSLACAGLVDGTSGAPWISGSTVTGVIGGLRRRRLRGEPVLLGAVRRHAPRSCWPALRPAARAIPPPNDYDDELLAGGPISGGTG